MSRLKKVLDKWRRGEIPPEVERSDIELVLDEYFPGRWRFTTSSHIVVHDKRLRNLVDSVNDELTIPTVSGRKVKCFYAKKLMRVVRMLEELENRG